MYFWLTFSSYLPQYDNLPPVQSHCLLGDRIIIQLQTI